MGRQKQLHPDEPRYLPSTTRAVAWGALFFAFLSFLMSATTLVLTWQDGRLARNASQLMQEARIAFEKKRNAKAETAAAVAETDDPQRQNVTQQLDRYVQMIKDGDKSARFYLDGLRTELEQFQTKSKERGAEWMVEASATIQKAREDLTNDAPEAARKLQELARRLSTGEKPDAPAEKENATDKKADAPGEKS